MENPIVKLFNDLTDEELQILMDEVIHCETVGYFPENATIRTLTKKCSEITQTDTASNLLMVQMNVFKQGAIRWIKLKENEKE